MAQTSLQNMRKILWTFAEVQVIALINPPNKQWEKLANYNNLCCYSVSPVGCVWAQLLQRNTDSYQKCWVNMTYTLGSLVFCNREKWTVHVNSPQESASKGSCIPAWKSTEVSSAGPQTKQNQAALRDGMLALYWYSRLWFIERNFSRNTKLSHRLYNCDALFQ